jgi:cell division protein FtsQ
MARRPDARPDMDARPSRPTRREETESASVLDNIRWGRLALWTALGMFVLVGTLFAWHRTEDFLVRDNRFRMAEPEDFAGLSPSLIVEGAHYASTSQIRHVFAPDFGRSLYLVPIDTRRQELLAIDWVQEATVSKIWPNTLKVHIDERHPVAFIRLPPNRKTGLSEFALIDKDGYILRPRTKAKFTLPVINGISEAEDRDNRRARVHRVLGMLDSIGPLASHISEVDASDVNNLVVAEHMENRILSLLVGDENFQSRMSNFVSNYNEIKMKRPDATTFDLRVDNLITVVGDQNSVQ